MQRIFLIGYMGSGKTTIGRMLSSRLRCRFVDMDAYIEKQESSTVAEIFAQQGEEYFRTLEQRCLHQLTDMNPQIISTGGGTPCFFDNMEYMQTRGVTVYLRLTAAELLHRLTTYGTHKRPLVANKSGEELQQFIVQGLAVRAPFYEQAALHVHGSEAEIVQQICAYLVSK